MGSNHCGYLVEGLIAPICSHRRGEKWCVDGHRAIPDSAECKRDIRDGAVYVRKPHPSGDGDNRKIRSTSNDFFESPTGARCR